MQNIFDRKEVALYAEDDMPQFAPGGVTISLESGKSILG